jgi:hypothetical protein
MLGRGWLGWLSKPHPILFSLFFFVLYEAFVEEHGHSRQMVHGVGR